MYEIINVRLSRSNALVQWGFKLQQVANNALVVMSVEPDSLADKSGIKKNDQVQEFFDGALENGIPWTQIVQRLQTANEISMVLERFVTEPLGLPWALSETKDNQVIVDHWDTEGRVIGHSDQNTKGYVHSFKTDYLDGQSVPNTNVMSENNSYLSTLPVKPSQGQKGHSDCNKDEDNVNTQLQCSKSSSRMDSCSNAPVQANQFCNRNQNWSGVHVLREGSLPVLRGAGPLLTNFQSKNDVQTQQHSLSTAHQATFNQQSRVTAPNNNQKGNLNGSSTHQNTASHVQNNNSPSYKLLEIDCYSKSQQEQVDTSQWYGHSQYSGQPQCNNQSLMGGRTYGRNIAAGRIATNVINHRSQSAAPYSGPRVYYQRNSPRTYRQLSPTATIQHLQYKSHVKMHSPHEQQRGSGLGVEDNYANQHQVYLGTQDG